MKYCPTCETRYDEEILRFCMKDGTPLLEEEEPNFIGMPSESLEMPDQEDDAAEVTIVRKKSEVPVPPAAPDPDSLLGDDDFSSVQHPSSQRIVVPMVQEVREAPRTYQPQYQHSPKPNTLKVVVLTIIGTISLLGLGALGFWALSGGSDNTNSNQNANLMDQNTNLNTNLGIDSNFNFNVNTNFNSGSSEFNTNFNTNTAVRTPTPTPTSTPTPRATPTPRPDPDEDDDDDDPRPTPTRAPTPILQPTIIRPGSSPQPRPQQQQVPQSPANRP